MSKKGIETLVGLFVVLENLIGQFLFNKAAEAGSPGAGK